MPTSSGAHASTLRTSDLRVPAERQSGDREPAPGDLALVQAFLNSRWDLDREWQDKFATPASLAEWLTDHGLLVSSSRIDSAALGRALGAREGLRALLFANNGCAYDPDEIARLNAVLRDARMVVQLAAGADPEFVAPGNDLDAALAILGAIIVTAQLQGRWSRLKACPGRDCGWVFFDHSRNKSATWCAMSVCGDREKAREYRRRRRGPGEPSGHT